MDGENLKIIRKDQNYFLESHLINQLRDIDMVKERALEMAAWLNGVARLYLGVLANIRVGGILWPNPDGTWMARSWGFVKRRVVCDVTPTMTLPTADGGPQEVSRATWVDKVLSAASHDTPVADALTKCGGDEPTWFDLFWLFEIVSEELGGGHRGRKEIVHRRWAEEPVLDLFANTANSRTAAGSLARHPYDRMRKGQIHPPQIPMSLDEAEALIMSLVRKWLESRVGQRT